MDQVKGVLTVPVDAVNYDNGKAFVYCYDNGAAKKVMIEAGIYDAQTMEVKSGLTAGDQVITTWSNELVDGQEVLLTVTMNRMKMQTRKRALQKMLEKKHRKQVNKRC